MLKDYDESEIALMRRDAKRKDEYEVNLIKKTAREEGLVEGEAKGKTEERNNSIIKMSKSGISNDKISEILELDISYVNEVLKNN